MEENEIQTPPSEPGNDEQLDPDQVEAPVHEDDEARRAEEERVEQQTPEQDDEQARRQAAREQHPPADSPGVDAPSTEPPAEGNDLGALTE